MNVCMYVCMYVCTYGHSVCMFVCLLDTQCCVLETTGYVGFAGFFSNRASLICSLYKACCILVISVFCKSYLSK